MAILCFEKKYLNLEHVFMIESPLAEPSFQFSQLSK